MDIIKYALCLRYKNQSILYREIIVASFEIHKNQIIQNYLMVHILLPLKG
jgi:hypothetical protein